VTSRLTRHLVSSTSLPVTCMASVASRRIDAQREFSVSCLCTTAAAPKKLEMTGEETMACGVLRSKKLKTVVRFDSIGLGASKHLSSRQIVAFGHLLAPQSSSSFHS